MARARQRRAFPTVRLHDEKVFFVWNADAPDDVRAALERLCSKVTRIGHSSSLVQMWVVDRDEAVQPNLTPDEFVSGQRMRIAEPGTLEYLEQTFERGERPRLVRWQGYRKAKDEHPAPVIDGIFDPQLIVFEKFDGRVLGLESTLQLTSALRNAATKALPEGEIPEWLSGHQANGMPTLKPHVAFFPLPFVDARYADGHILGLAMAIPRSVSANEGRLAIGPLLFHPESGDDSTIHLWRNDFWDWKLRRQARDNPQTALRSETWTEPSRVWASVTPVVLHHYPRKNSDSDVERILYEAFASAGLPCPDAIKTSPASVFEGAPHARSLPEFSEGGKKLCRYQTHVKVAFEQPVRGPVLVGRGRYRGYGLFRPVRRIRERS